MNRRWFAFVVGFVTEGIVISGLLVSIVRPDRRFWPPERLWTVGLYWFCVTLVAGSATVVGYLDRDSLGLDYLGRLPLCCALVGGGLTLSVRAWRDLHIAESMGLKGRLYTEGLYQYTRNPQYIGNLTAIGGFVLLANSVWFAILAAGNAVWHLLLPFAEEPWLTKQYGESYESYRERVPRFVGWHSIGQLLRRR